MLSSTLLFPYDFLYQTMAMMLPSEILGKSRCLPPAGLTRKHPTNQTESWFAPREAVAQNNDEEDSRSSNSVTGVPAAVFG